MLHYVRSPPDGRRHRFSSWLFCVKIPRRRTHPPPMRLFRTPGEDSSTFFLYESADGKQGPLVFVQTPFLFVRDIEAYERPRGAFGRAFFLRQRGLGV